MASVRDVCHGALRRLTVLAIGEEADPDTVQVALDAYNAMHREAKRAGWLTEWTDVGLNDPADPELSEAAKAAVAVRIAVDFARPVDRRLALDGALWMAQVAAAADNAATFETAFYRQIDEYSAE